MKLSPCVEILFPGMNMEDRLGEVKKAGFDVFEFWGWWDKDIDRLISIKDELGLSVSTFCTKSTSLVDSTRHGEYLQGLEESIDVAKALRCDRLIAQTGQAVPGMSREEQRQNLIEGLRKCLPLLESEGITLLLEPLNTLVDHKGYYLERSDEAFAVIEEVGSPQIKVLFDIYHQQITEGNLIPNITSYIDKIGHFHVADHPGRHEPGTGEIHYGNVLKAIAATGYTGYIGLEYKPLGDVSQSFRDVKALAGWAREAK